MKRITLERLRSKLSFRSRIQGCVCVAGGHVEVMQKLVLQLDIRVRPGTHHVPSYQRVKGDLLDA